MAEHTLHHKPLTPEILTTAGWIKVGIISDTGLRKHCGHVEIYISTRKGISITVYDDYRVNPLHTLTLDTITVGEFNTLLDIVKLNNFQIK